MPAAAAALRTALLAAGVLLAVGGCSGNSVSVGSTGGSGSSSRGSSGGSVSSSLNCRDDRCTLKIAGDPSGTRLGVLGRGVRVEAIEADAVTVRIDDEVARVPAGTTSTVGGLAVTVVSTRADGNGRAAELAIQRR